MPFDLDLYPAGSRLVDGELYLGGCPASAIAAAYGTPALVVSEDALRARAREYLTAFTARHSDSRVYFASKAFAAVSIERILASEGIGCDVVSVGELAIARAAGMDPARMVLHGNAKSDDDVRAALDAGVGHVVVDGPDDVDRLARLAVIPQPVLLRVTPGIDADTHEAMATGHYASKFGVPVDRAADMIARIEAEPMLRMDGLHAHIGSAITALDQFRAAVAALATLGRWPVYDLGGGLGVPYTSGDPWVSVDAYADAVVGAVHEHLGRDVTLIVEPGRSMVAQSVVTLYTVTTVKHGDRTHVAVDGGMGENLEYALYGQRFQPSTLGRSGPEVTVDLVGRHCETGDIVVPAASMVLPRVGDLVALPVTGAYTYSMSNNYNAALRPPVVFCSAGKARLGIRRETVEDLMRREC
jgi:diaminopimelate decarboxylase